MTLEARVSVIIPCYNGARYLRDSIESVCRQTHPAHEIIVVDDGSTDASAAIASSFAEVRLIRQANQGVSAARNLALSHATGDFIVFHDADDRLLPRALETGVRELARRPEVAFVFGFSHGIRADGTPIGEPNLEPIVDAGYARLLAGGTLVPPSTAIFRRHVVEAVGGFSVGMALSEDYDLYLRIARQFPIHCHNELVVDYRQHDGNASLESASQSLRSTLRALNAQAEFVRDQPELAAALERGRKHWGRMFGRSIAFELAHLVKRLELRRAANALLLLLRHHPRGLIELARFRLDLLLGRV